jgi:hypothetical protein
MAFNEMHSRQPLTPVRTEEGRPTFDGNGTRVGAVVGLVANKKTMMVGYLRRLSRCRNALAALNVDSAYLANLSLQPLERAPVRANSWLTNPRPLAVLDEQA